MRLTMKTNLAMRVLMACAAQPDKLVRKHEIATSCGASEAHLALVIHQLGQTGFLTTHRGRGGGIELAHDPLKLTVGEVYRALEPDHSVTECLTRDHENCPRAKDCSLTKLMCEALDAFYQVLDKVTVQDLVTGNPALRAAFDLDPLVAEAS